MTLVRNISTGPRGAWLGGVLVMAEVGETIEADDFATEWFDPAKDGPLDRDSSGDEGGSLPADPPSLSGKTKAELIEIAEAEGVEADDGMKVDEIKAAIEAARAE